MLGTKALHPNSLVVAHVIIEGIRLAAEVVHDGLRAEGGHHLGVVPGKAQVVIGHLSAGHCGCGCTCALLGCGGGKRLQCFLAWQ